MELTTLHIIIFSLGLSSSIIGIVGCIKMFVNYYDNETKKLIVTKQEILEEHRATFTTIKNNIEEFLYHEPVFHPPYMTEEFFDFPDNSPRMHRIFYGSYNDVPGHGQGIVEDHEPWCLRTQYRGCTGGIGEEYLELCPNPLRINDHDKNLYTRAFNVLRDKELYEKLTPEFARE